MSSYRLLERFVKGKHLEEDCEDGIVVTPDFVAVIDGSTSKTATRIDPNMKNGRLCMLSIAKYIENMPHETSLEDFCEGITKSIHDLYPADDSAFKAAPHLRLCASVALYSTYLNEVWLVGDCQCRIDEKCFDNPKPYEERIARMRSGVWKQMLNAHPDMVENGTIVHDYARDAVICELVNSMKEENRSYAVVDGYPIFRQGIRVLSLPEDSKEHSLILASDGYPVLATTLEESEKALRNLLRQDPYCVDKWLATKGLMKGNCSFDDRSYVRLIIRG